MRILPGPSALSSFRINRLVEAMQCIDGNIDALFARYVHFADIDGDLDPEQESHLSALLAYDDEAVWADDEGWSRWVIPRPGTVSPWSSKASEIVARCGLTAIKRLERGVEYRLVGRQPSTQPQCDELTALLHDRMTQVVVDQLAAIDLFASHPAQPLQTITVLEQGRSALEQANQALGMALSADEIAYLETCFQKLERNPTDVELMMFAQANSEHCRHKIFNASWTVDGKKQAQSLFKMIRHTSDKSPQGILSAYHDNAAVIEGSVNEVFMRQPDSGEYAYRKEAVHLLMKVETHNHPTAISPYPGAATGSGGEIRDEAATGKGATTKAGLTGFSVSHLLVPDFVQPWETDFGKPERIASALQIMLQGPLGGAAFNNEFGRPNLAGYFRTFGQVHEQGLPQHYRGYHKPIMIAGGMGNIRPMLVKKQNIPPGSLIVVLGGPAMLIGLGGGAASSQSSGKSSAELDFASVQRENPEMQRRCQEVINHCNAMGEKSPIISIHDVGAGGLSNAVPEIVHDCNRGGRFELHNVPVADSGLSPMQIWCNEAQERYVLAIKTKSLETFSALCERENCLYSVIGTAVGERHLTLHDGRTGENAVDIPMSVLFGKPPKLQRDARPADNALRPLQLQDVEFAEAVRRVLSFPAVADKSFLIHIGDRSVTGLVARDQLVGPWQVAVADVAVTAAGFKSYAGEAMAMGERAPLALINAPASGRMAIAEMLTNLAASRIASLGQIKLSANWMAACGSPEGDAALFATVKAVALEFCPQLGLAIPVGKDSLSMTSLWPGRDGDQVMTAPLSLIVTGFAPVVDIRKTLTPQLQDEDSVLILIDLGMGKNRLGGSVLAQVFKQLGDSAPDIDDPELLKRFFRVLQQLNQANLILAYHDRSDGGLLATVAEMVFAGRLGVALKTDLLGGDALAALFSEEAGAVIQVRRQDSEAVLKRLQRGGLGGCSHLIGRIVGEQRLSIEHGGQTLFSDSRASLQQIWSALSYRMQALRDHPECAEQQYRQIADDGDPGLTVNLSFDVEDNISAPLLKKRPKVAILREQGVNGYAEMAAAFDRAGFQAIDVHMSDIVQGRRRLSDFVGFAACGGFSYGDVLGAGGGWARSILYNSRARDEFSAFFQRSDTFGLGVCNGCQMLAGLTEIMPGAENWPRFRRNLSEQFESRVVMVKVEKSPSIFLQGMEGSRLPVVVAHGEGRVEFARPPRKVKVVLSYINNYGVLTTDFPANPNGSPLGIAGLTTLDGRFTAMMPHPERCFRSVQNSWHPGDWGEDGAWLRMFRNARVRVG